MFFHKLWLIFVQFVLFVVGCTGIKACMKAMEPVSEEQYEISLDIHGIMGGPRLGRLRLINKVISSFHYHNSIFNSQ